MGVSEDKEVRGEEEEVEEEEEKRTGEEDEARDLEDTAHTAFQDNALALFTATAG